MKLWKALTVQIDEVNKFMDSFGRFFGKVIWWTVLVSLAIKAIRWALEGLL